MEGREREVLYYQTVSGAQPFKEWRDSISDDDLRATIYARVGRLRGGNFGDSKAVGDGASENRIHLGSGYRIYYGVDGDNIVLLCAGEKSTQDADIIRAKDYWGDYKDRKRDSEKGGLKNVGLQKILLNDLKNRPGFAAKYLTAAANDSDEAFLVALRDIGMARTGMTGLAAAAEVNRVNLYHMLSERGNPGIRNVRSIFRALKFRVKIEDVLEKVTPAPSPTATYQAHKEQAGSTSISDFTKLYSYGIPIAVSYNPLITPPQTVAFAFGANGNTTNTGLGAMGHHPLASAKQSAPPLHLHR